MGGTCQPPILEPSLMVLIVSATTGKIPPGTSILFCLGECRVVHTLLSGGLLDLLGQANTDEAVVGLELLHGLGRVVDKAETSGLAATELGAQAEDGDLVLAGLVHAGELVAELILGDVGTVGVQDVTIRKEDQRLAKRVFLQSTVCL